MKQLINRLDKPHLQAKQIIKVFNIADKQDLIDGFSWYRDANRICVNMAEKHEITIIKSAGIVSALSPGTTWKQNIKDAELFMRAMETDMYLSDIIVTTYGQFKLKAYKIWHECNTHSDILDVLCVGETNKTKSFYLNIINPITGEGVTVDRHAMRIALGHKDGNKLNLTPKRYKDISKAYHIASEITGIQPHELQAITWVTGRRKLYGLN